MQFINSKKLFIPDFVLQSGFGAAVFFIFAVGYSLGVMRQFAPPWGFPHTPAFAAAQPSYVDLLWGYMVGVMLPGGPCTYPVSSLCLPPAHTQ